MTTTTLTPFQVDLRQRQIASFGAVKIVTRDQHEALKQIRTALKYEMSLWSCASGVWRVLDDGEMVPDEEELTDPFDIARKLRSLMEEKWDSARHTMVLVDFDHWLDTEPAIRRYVVEATRTARALGHLLLFVSRHDKLHPELSDELNTLRHPLPGRESARELLGLFAKAEVDVPAEQALDVVQGLTSSRQADAFGLAVAQAKLAGSSQGDLGVLRRYKESEIGRLNYLTVSEPEKGFADLIGHDYLKRWLGETRLAFSPQARERAVPVPRGMLLVGPPGTGKTRLAEATAAEWRIPFLTLNLASVFSSLLGESEANIANALEIAERMAPCVLLIDEIESVIKDGEGDRDGGTTDRVIGQLLTWTSLKKESVFLIGTSNVAKGLPPALIRKGRLDEIFFVDFSSAEERRQIFDYYLAQAPHAVQDVDKLVRATAEWSGAEIEAVVQGGRRSAYADGDRLLTDDDIAQQMNRTTPVSKSMADKVKGMRDWASKNACLTTDVASGGKHAWSGSARKVEA